MNCFKIWRVGQRVSSASSSTQRNATQRNATHLATDGRRCEARLVNLKVHLAKDECILRRSIEDLAAVNRAR